MNPTLRFHGCYGYNLREWQAGSTQYFLVIKQAQKFMSAFQSKKVQACNRNIICFLNKMYSWEKKPNLKLLGVQGCL